jgi:ribosome-associated protein
VRPAVEPTRRSGAPEVPEAAIRAARVADEKQGIEPVVLAMGRVLEVTDAFVIVSGRNPRHVKTIVEEIERRLKLEEGRAPVQVEGLGDLQWVCMDYGDLLVHVFSEEARSYYDLERLWGDAPRVDRTTPAGL